MAAAATARAEFMKTNAKAPTAAGGGGHEQHQLRSTSSWHSPVPYLFGGLAAMLGLIAFALLILACSYWKLSGYLDNNGEGDVEAGEAGRGEGENEKQGGGGDVGVGYEEKILVIMAGDVKPTYLATPSSMSSSSSSGSSSRSSSFGSNNSCSCTHNSTSGLGLVKEASGRLERETPPQLSSSSQNQNSNSNL